MVADGNSADAPIHAIARFHGRDLMRIREGEPVAERDHHGDRPEEDAPAEGRTAEELTPDTGKPVSKLNLGRFGAGFIFFCIVFMMSGTIGSTVLLPARFNTLGIGQGETILGTMNSIGIIFALISNVIFGSLSDASHSRFGKRTPWIIIGGPIAGIGFYLTSISPTLPTIVASWSLLQIGLNCMIAPCVAILSDRVPQKYRGSMSAFYGAGQIVGQSMGTIIGSAFIDAPKTGFMIDTICWCLCGIGTVLLLPRELSAATADAERFDIRQIAMQFRPPTKGARDFYLGARRTSDAHLRLQHDRRLPAVCVHEVHRTGRQGRGLHRVHHGRDHHGRPPPSYPWSPARSPTGSASASYRCSSPPPSSPSASPCRGCSSPSSPCSSKTRRSWASDTASTWWSIRR